jgi:hypothetical protein
MNAAAASVPSPSEIQNSVVSWSPITSCATDLANSDCHSMPEPVARPP